MLQDLVVFATKQLERLMKWEEHGVGEKENEESEHDEGQTHE